MIRRPHTTLATGGIAVLAAVAAAALPLPAAGAACAARSGERTVALVELYTSEGCSSCPPADRWLAATFRDAAAAAHAVALAFHVDYWDRLGWKDRFARAAYTGRQYAEARANGERFVYTPQVLVQGRDHPGWHALSLGAGGAIAAANATPARAAIALEVAPQPGGALAVKARVQVPAHADRTGATTYVALVESGLASEVKAGENAGARLVHDHVVRAFRAGAAADASGAATTQVVLAWPDEAGTAATVVAFVQNPETGDVLQALALPLAGCGVER
jgi:hypothetical protein